MNYCAFCRMPIKVDQQQIHKYRLIDGTGWNSINLGRPYKSTIRGVKVYRHKDCFLRLGKPFAEQEAITYSRLMNGVVK